ncbi:MAG: DUF2490 domain-containing protein [Bacteroidetes bacterium]|jgi:hypothetical protein|nr:DUF2490 domain-containing protein [Bacteroidota bacterium]
MKSFITSLLFILWPLSSFAQTGPEWIWNPELSYSKRVSDRTTLIAKLSVFNSLENITNQKFLRYIEPQLSGSYTLTTRWKVGGGYYYRRPEPLLDGNGYEHRLLQQAGYISFLGDQRLAHRFRLEQRIRSSSFQNRIRYQLSFDFPLQGEQLDPGERYLILKNEVMAAFNASESDAENRASLGMGWYLSRKQKFEINFQYRTQDIRSGSGVTHLLLFGSTFYINR